MATQLTITAVDYTNSPAVDETFTFEYKLSTGSTYTTISSGSVVHPTGLLAVPLTVTGLTPGQAYIVRASPNCSSPNAYFFLTFNT